MVKFNDLQVGKRYIFTSFDEDGVAFTIRNPNANVDAILAKHRSHIGVPFTVRGRIEADLDGPDSWRVRFDNGDLGNLSSPGYGATNFNQGAITGEVSKQIKEAPLPSARRVKNIAMGELRAMPGAVDYEQAASKWPGKSGGKKQTRKRRSKKHVRRTTRRARK